MLMSSRGFWSLLWLVLVCLLLYRATKEEPECSSAVRVFSDHPEERSSTRSNALVSSAPSPTQSVPHSASGDKSSRPTPPETQSTAATAAPLALDPDELQLILNRLAFKTGPKIRPRCRNWHTISGKVEDLRSNRKSGGSRGGDVSTPDPDTLVCMDAILRKRSKTPPEPCFAVSIGIDNIWTFDDYMLEQGCTVFAVDPSMVKVDEEQVEEKAAAAAVRTQEEGFRRHPERHRFYHAGIGEWDTYEEDGVRGKMRKGDEQDGSKEASRPFQGFYDLPSQYRTITLDRLMRDMGTAHLDVIRMDCEGAEWPVLARWLWGGRIGGGKPSKIFPGGTSAAESSGGKGIGNGGPLIDRIDQLLLEIHYDQKGLELQMRVTKALFAGETPPFEGFHGVRNAWAGGVVGGTQRLSPVWELGLWRQGWAQTELVVRVVSPEDMVNNV